MEKILSISDQLHKLIDSAELEANKIIAEAQKKADKMILEEKTRAEKKLIRAQRIYKQREEKKIKIQATRILEEYRKKADLLKKISNEQLLIAVNIILNEVLPQ